MSDDFMTPSQAPVFAEGNILPGYWSYRGSDRSFLLDKRCAHYFGLEHSNNWIPEILVLERMSMRNIERYYRVMETRDMGSIIFEDIEITKGSYANKNFVVNGSVLARFQDGKVRTAVGYITNVQSSFSEFIAREIAGDSFFSWEATTRSLRFTPSYSSLLGYEVYEFNCTFAQWVNALVHPDDHDIVDVENHILSSPEYGDNFEFCVRLRHACGTYIWAIGRGIVINRNNEGMATSLIGTLSDINLVQDNFESIKQMLYTDTLTGLKNRSYFLHHAAFWQEDAVQPVSVIYADIAGLKITNDVLGHADGDVLLLSLTEILTDVITRTCEVMRLAGDEFLVILPQCDQEESKHWLNTLKEAVVKHNRQRDIMPLFVGFGRATMGEFEQDTLHACIERADVRMQAYKDATRKDNYRQLQEYLEMRKGRPVSMRDGRRLEYMTNEEREAMSAIKVESGKTPY